MIIRADAGKLNPLIGQFEGPIMAFLEKQESDNAEVSLKSDLYTVKKSTHYSESVTGVTGINDFEMTDGPVPYDDIDDTFPKTFTHKVFQRGIQINRTTIDDSNLMDMQNQTSAITDAANRTIENFVHLPFNFCNQKEVITGNGKKYPLIGADGMPLCHDKHPSKTGKTSIQSNLTDLALTPENLTTVENMMDDYKVEGGIKGNFKVDTLIIPYRLRDVAWEICGTPSSLNSPNGNVNPKYRKYNVIISNDLKDPKKWFAVDSRSMKRNLMWLDRIPMEIDSWWDKNTKTWHVDGYMRFVNGFVDWRWCIGNIPTK